MGEGPTEQRTGVRQFWASRATTKNRPIGGTVSVGSHLQATD